MDTGFKQCSCGGTRMFQQGVGKTGKPYAMWKCTNPTCEIEWVNSSVSTKSTPPSPKAHVGSFQGKTAEDTLLNTCLITAKDLLLCSLDKAKPVEVDFLSVSMLTLAESLYIGAKAIKTGTLGSQL